MIFKKTGSKIFGVQLNTKEQQALRDEVKKQLIEYDYAHANELDAIILWLLHERFGFGKKRLREFYDAFSVDTNALMERYELDDDDKIWMCTRLLKEYGIDVAKWREEKAEK